MLKTRSDASERQPNERRRKVLPTPRSGTFQRASHAAAAIKTTPIVLVT